MPIVETVEDRAELPWVVAVEVESHLPESAGPIELGDTIVIELNTAALSQTHKLVRFGFDLESAERFALLILKTIEDHRQMAEQQS